MYVIVAGAGLIGQEVIHKLVENNHNVVVIDIDSAVCKAIHSETGALSVHGNATDIRMLEKAGARKADVLVCMMHNAADNTSCALLAKSLGIRRIIGRLRHHQHDEAYRVAGIDTVVHVSDIMADQIMMEIEQPKVKKIMSFQDGKAEIYAVRIPPKAKSIGLKISEIAQKKTFPKECIFIGIYRDRTGEYVIPRGESEFREGDTVFIILRKSDLSRIAALLTKKRFLGGSK